MPRLRAPLRAYARTRACIYPQTDAHTWNQKCLRSLPQVCWLAVTQVEPSSEPGRWDVLHLSLSGSTCLLVPSLACLLLSLSPCLLVLSSTLLVLSSPCCSVSLPPCLLLSLPPYLPVSLSHCQPTSLSACLVSQLKAQGSPALGSNSDFLGKSHEKSQR